MSIEKKTAGNGTFAALYCAIFGTPGFCKSSMFFETSIASLDKKTKQNNNNNNKQSKYRPFYILSTMFTGACGPPEKLSLALMPRSYALRMIVKVAFSISCLQFHGCYRQHNVPPSVKLVLHELFKNLLISFHFLLLPFFRNFVWPTGAVALMHV